MMVEEEAEDTMVVAGVETPVAGEEDGILAERILLPRRRTTMGPGMVG